MKKLPQEIPARFAPMFEDYPDFRKMQLDVLPTLIGTDNNVVISAPTGGGKTVMMEFAMIRALRSNSRGRKPTVVYLCPLKTLSGEKLKTWTPKLRKCGLVVNELTGDSHKWNEKTVLDTSDVICATSEKFDWLTRKHSDLASRVRLLLVDEVHTISERGRGPVLEAFITRLKLLRSSQQPSSSPPLRIVAVSATISNIEDLGVWLGPNCSHFFFDNSHRPVPLFKAVESFDSYRSSAYYFDKSLDRKMPGILSKYSDNKPALIFCMCRKSTEESAANLKNFMAKSSDSELINASNDVRDPTLRETLCHGVAFHNSGLSYGDRGTVENLFRQYKIRALFSTTTLAAGVNLPAHLVVIKGTQFCFGKDGAPQDLDGTRFMQMIGRAGRPNMDTFGQAVVMTTHDKAEHYRDLFEGEDLESELFRRVPETINAEIALGGVRTLQDAVEWLRNSFFYVRLSKNQQLYTRQFNELNETFFEDSFGDESMIRSQDSFVSSSSTFPTDASNVPVDECLSSLVNNAVNELCDIGLVTYNLNASSDLGCTDFGKKMARQCIQLKTMKSIMANSVDGNLTLDKLFDMLAHSDELASEVLRTEEEKHLDNYLKLLRFQLPKGPDARQAKVFVLMQVVLSNNEVKPDCLGNDVRRLFRTAVRLANCFLDVIELRHERFLQTLQTACIFSKILNAELWHDSEYLSKQLPNIGPAFSRHLANAGYTSFEKLCSASDVAIQNCCHRNHPFGLQVRNDAAHMPRYSVSLEQTGLLSPSTANLVVKVKLLNAERLQKRAVAGLRHRFVVFVGDVDNNLVIGLWRLTDNDLVYSNGNWSREVSTVGKTSIIKAYIISLEVVGVDVECCFVPTFLKDEESLCTCDFPVSSSTPVKKVGVKRELNRSSASYESDDDETLMAKLAKCPSLDLDGSSVYMANDDAFQSEDDEAVLEKAIKLESESEAAFSTQDSSAVFQSSSQEVGTEDDDDDDETLLSKIRDKDGTFLF